MNAMAHGVARNRISAGIGGWAIVVSGSSSCLNLVFTAGTREKAEQIILMLAREVVGAQDWEELNHFVVDIVNPCSSTYCPSNCSGACRATAIWATFAFKDEIHLT